jgi:hypothetical protein
MRGMNAREKVGVALHFITLGVLAAFLAYVLWAIGHGIFLTNTLTEAVLASSVVLLAVGIALVNGRPITKVLRNRA